MMSQGFIRTTTRVTPSLFRSAASRAAVARTGPALSFGSSLPQGRAMTAAADQAATIDPMEVFRMVDINGDGQISREEFHAMVANMDEPSLRDAASRVFDVFDNDNDGLLGEDDFKDALGFYTGGELKRLRLSLARNELSNTHEDEDVGPPTSMNIGRRFGLTVEVAVSKIFPAGFGWQGASVIADGMGYEATDMGFFLITGLGDGLGVFVGHSLYFAIKKAITGNKGINMSHELQTGWWLGSAAVCSGTIWQPTVNFFHETSNLGFTPVALGVTAVCGVAFYTGLRLGRLAYGGFMDAIAPPSYGNLKADALLSVAIGGATGAFVGTDCSFGIGAGDTNWLRGLFGIEDGTSDLVGMVTAGSSTAFGFTAFQAVENFTLRPGANWVD